MLSVRVWGDLLHQFGQDALSALPVGVRCTAAATSPQELELNAATNPSTKTGRALDKIKTCQRVDA